MPPEYIGLCAALGFVMLFLLAFGVFVWQFGGDE